MPATTRRELAEQAVATHGPKEAIRRGWDAEEIWDAMQRIHDANVVHTLVDEAAAELATVQSRTVPEYHNRRRY
jgi:hypothetical protein